MSEHKTEATEGDNTHGEFTMEVAGKKFAFPARLPDTPEFTKHYAIHNSRIYGPGLLDDLYHHPCAPLLQAMGCDSFSGTSMVMCCYKDVAKFYGVDAEALLREWVNERGVYYAMGVMA